MNLPQALLLLLGASCATTSATVKPGKQAWSNVTSELDFDCFRQQRCQKYQLGLRAGAPVKLRLEAAGEVSVVVESEWMEDTVKAAATAGGPAETTFTMRGTPEDFRVASVFVVTARGQAPVEYSLEVSPAPASVFQSPSSKAERLATLERRRQEQAVQEKSERRADEARGERGASCQGGNVIIERRRTKVGREEFLFCDGTRLGFDPPAQWDLTRKLAGEAYERFVSAEAATLEVASHNARVLKTNTARQAEADARAAFDAKVERFISKNLWPKERYIAEAKRCTLPPVSE